jgi:hypothetical protein
MNSRAKQLRFNNEGGFMWTMKLGSIVNNNKFVCSLVCASAVVIVVMAFVNHPTAMASSVSIGGQDNSAQMKDVKNLITTIQNIGFNWVAKVIGGFMVIGGVYKVASRDFLNGILATGGGGTLFFVEKIADSLSRMSGN